MLLTYGSQYCRRAVHKDFGNKSEFNCIIMLKIASKLPLVTE